MTTPFKLRSGNTTPFKQMGSSPVKQEEEIITKEENPEEENKSCQVNQTTSHIQSIELNGPMRCPIRVGLMTENLLK